MTPVDVFSSLHDVCLELLVGTVSPCKTGACCSEALADVYHS